ncbi:MAG: hypothetical protein RR296_11440, partial [Clostridia bacterium]
YARAPAKSALPCPKSPKTFRPRPCFPVICFILKTSGCDTKLLSCHSPFWSETKKTRRFIGKYSTEFSQIAALWTKSKDYAHS